MPSGTTDERLREIDAWLEPRVLRALDRKRPRLTIPPRIVRLHYPITSGSRTPLDSLRTILRKNNHPFAPTVVERRPHTLYVTFVRI